MEKRASCYDICSYGHNCFGGYLVKEELCDKEILKIKDTLQNENPDGTILFAPKNIVGLRFKVIKSASEPEAVYRLQDGEITLLETPK